MAVTSARISFKENPIVLHNFCDTIDIRDDKIENRRAGTAATVSDFGFWFNWNPIIKSLSSVPSRYPLQRQELNEIHLQLIRTIKTFTVSNLPREKLNYHIAIANVRFFTFRSFESLFGKIFWNFPETGNILEVRRLSLAINTWFLLIFIVSIVDDRN